MKSLQICIAAALLTLLGAGCSSSSNTPASTGGAQGACDSYCTKLGTCGDAGASEVTTCKADMCAAMTGLTAACDSAAAAYFNCLAAESNMCTSGGTGCDSQANSMATACPQSS